MTLCRSRLNCGAATVAPLALGNRPCRASFSARTSVRSAPTARSSGPAVPSVCSSSAPSRCAGSTAGLPRSTECRTAADSASWLFVVSLLASIYSAPCSISTESTSQKLSLFHSTSGSRTFSLSPAVGLPDHQRGRRLAGLLQLGQQRLDLPLQRLDLLLERDDPLDPGEVDALLLGQPLHLAQQRHVPGRVAPAAAGGPARVDEP